MARTSAITREKLEALGAAALAELVLTQCAADPAFGRRVRLELAGSGSGSALHREIDRRLAALARTSRFVERRETVGVARELDALRQTMTTRLVAVDAAAACDRLMRFLGFAEATFERSDDSDGALAEVFRASVDDLGRIWAGRVDRRPEDVASFVLRAIEGNEYGVLDHVVEAFSDALAAAGQAALKRQLEAKLAALPRAGAEDWQRRSERGVYVRALEALADRAGDVDAYIAASAAEPIYDGKRHDIAQHLLAAGRAQEALAWLEPCGAFAEGRLVDLRLAALEALDQKDKAQELRWDWFERTMSAGHARDYIRRLPDFDGFAAERRAVRTALTHPDPHAALGFLLALPDLAAADELVRRDIELLNPRAYDLFNAAAERLAERYPLAATLLWRRKVEDVLERASSVQYGYAARDVQRAASVAQLVPEGAGQPGHEEWLVRLQQVHGRKWKFWELVGRKR